jgi:predicted 2-oxoglutarate/Fe(II)-dependent dioxygenase YbiX
MSEIETLTLRGTQLLTGRGAPLAPSQGIAELARASALGGAQAAAILAALAGMGVGAPPNWPRALELLTLAAERGSKSAQGQLRLLAGQPDAQDGWAAVAQGVDIAAWTAPPVRRPICEAPRIRMLDGFVSPEVCAWLIGIGQDRLTQAQVYDTRTGGAALHATRTNSAFELSIVDVDLVTVLVRARIAAAAAVPVGAFEPPQLLHYAVGQTFGRHYDYLDVSKPGYAKNVAEHGQRVLTALIYLNDGYEGGETSFPKAGIEIRARAGDGVMFANVDRANAADPMSLHAGEPPTSGEKWIFSQWIRDRAQGGG